MSATEPVPFCLTVKVLESKPMSNFTDPSRSKPEFSITLISTVTAFEEASPSFGPMEIQSCSVVAFQSLVAVT